MAEAQPHFASLAAIQREAGQVYLAAEELRHSAGLLNVVHVVDLGPDYSYLADILAKLPPAP